MEVDSLIIESLTPQQYKQFYNDLPLPIIAVNHNRKDYIESLSSDEYQKKLLNTMLNNNLSVSNVSDGSINILIDLDNGKIIKYLKEHVNLNNINIDIKALTSRVLNVNIKFNSKRDMQILNQMLENYYLVNKTGFSKEANDYVISLYKQHPKEYFDYLKEVNKEEIMHLKEKHFQETTSPFNENNNLEISNIFDNEVLVTDIYNNDELYKNIPFNKLNDEKKQTMCNRYFRKVIKERITELNYKLKEMYGIDYKVDFLNQFEQGEENYGISGNLPPLEESNINEIRIRMNPNIDYCSINGDKAILNTDLLGQIMITLLHEHEHILQRVGMIDDNLKESIINFESINPSGSISYMENYKDDPAEIDANLASFNRLIEMSKYVNIDNPDNIILNRVKRFIGYVDESMNFYGNNRFNNAIEVQEYLYQKLQNSIVTYNNIETEANAK